MGIGKCHKGSTNVDYNIAELVITWSIPHYHNIYHDAKLITLLRGVSHIIHSLLVDRAATAIKVYVIEFRNHNYKA